ncbi:MAG TPA: Gmad2 immunoglobulin-like domain-containing protein [Candidatus Paceibacterota bacterium]|nr:Gmad2 immunoglobulin-like domain-containing protein [Candidatus Paceibacterota bacterium]
MKLIAGFIVVLGILFAAWFWFAPAPEDTSVSAITSFESCVAAGYSIAGTAPRQCKLPDGRVYAEEVSVPITYVNASASVIVVENPYPGAVTGKEFSVTGKARAWYFEGSFPVEVLDKNGVRLVAVPAQAQGEWMTSEFVPFKADIKISNSYTGPATLVLHKDNPSGMPENDASAAFPITIEY